MLINFNIYADTVVNRVPVTIHLEFKPNSINGYNFEDTINPELTITPGKSNIDSRDSNFVVTEVVTAHLDAPDFKITPPPAEEQLIEDQGVWSWLLTPQKTGNQLPVKVNVMLHIKYGDRDEVHALPPFNRTLIVRQTPQQEFLQWLNENWGKLLNSTALIALFGWLGKKFFDKLHK